MPSPGVLLKKGLAAYGITLPQLQDETAALDSEAGGAFDGTFTESAEPAAPADGSLIVWAKDAGAGKTALMVRFPTGDSIQIAVEA